MLPIRPRLLHFTIWLVMFPVLVYELKLLYEITSRSDLEAQRNTNSAVAQITETRRDDEGSPQIRYTFYVTDVLTQYSATDFTGRTNLWIHLTDKSWEYASKTNTIKVTYLNSDPWINDPDGKTGVLLSASIMVWGFLFVIDLIWVAELCLLGINLFKCLRSLLKGEGLRIHFWETRPEWNGIVIRDPEYELDQSGNWY